jgi:hypothetical protein
MLSLVEQGGPRGTVGGVAPRLGELTNALTHEHGLIEELRQALLRQREGVATDDPEAIESSVHAISRTLLTLEEARRGRIALTALIAGEPGVPLADLDANLGLALPASFVEARERVRRAAEATALEVAINQTVLRRALEAGDAFLQQLFSSVADPMPVYVPGPRPADIRPSGMLLNRRA